MPVFNRPRRVVVTPGPSSPVAAVAIVSAIGAAVLFAAGHLAVITDVLFVILAVLLAICLAGAAALLVILRRVRPGGIIVPRRRRYLASRLRAVRAVRAAPEPATRPVITGTVTPAVMPSAIGGRPAVAPAALPASRPPASRRAALSLPVAAARKGGRP